MAICYVLRPIFYRRKLSKFYQNQELGEPRTIEVSDAGIRSTILGKADTHFDWAFFNGYDENDELFILIQNKQAKFVVFPKSDMQENSLQELRELAARHLSRA